MEKSRAGRPKEGHGALIYNSPHRHFVNQLLAAGYPPEDISKILWQQFRFKVSGVTVNNYRITFFEPMKEQVKKELMEIDAFETAARRELAEIDMLRGIIEELEADAEYLKEMRDTSSIKLRSDILFKAGSLRAKVIQFNFNESMKKREETLINGMVSIIASTVLPHVPEDSIEEVKSNFKSKLETFLETGTIK